jgi:hypothetical protein
MFEFLGIFRPGNIIRFYYDYYSLFCDKFPLALARTV